MSGTDYTRTPNLQLYKPVYDADDGQWGTHLNSNADVLDALFPGGPSSGPFLPLAGGTVSGATIFSTFLTVGAGAATVNSGAGAPTATRPVGSLYMRTDGTAGARLYVSAGGGTWAAVAGV